jgi:hypothetical protein
MEGDFLTSWACISSSRTILHAVGHINYIMALDNI